VGVQVYFPTRLHDVHRDNVNLLISFAISKIADIATIVKLGSFSTSQKISHILQR
jgi:hypothetical protein